MKRKAFSCAVLSMATALLIPGISLANPANTIGQWFNRSGKWYYGKDEDSLRKEWIVSNGDWYYLHKDSGELQSGWLSLNGKKYFLNTLHNGQFGKLLTGWQWIDGYCYFFEAEDSKTLGELKVSGSKDGYELDENGRYLLNGTVVYEAGKGLPGTESGQSVAGASRLIPSTTSGSSSRTRSRRSSSTGNGSTEGNTVSPSLPSKDAQSEAKKDSEKQENIEKSSGSQMQKPKEEAKPEQPKEEKKPEVPKEDKKPELPKEDKKPEVPKEEEKKQSLMDGVYFGTSKEGIHFQEKGPNIVKLRIENGKIVSAESVVFTDDTEPEFFAKYRDQFLERVKGLDSVDEVKKSVSSKSGKYYDGLSGATRTLLSHTSAVENALSQAKKKEGGKEFPFSYMEFESRPNPSQSGKNLDLSATRLKLHFQNGESKVVGPEDFAQYGITSSPAQGSPIKEGTKEILVHFLQKDMEIDLVSAIVPRAEIRKKYPTEIQVHYADGGSYTLVLDQENFRYTIPAKGKIDHMHLMDGNKEVARSRYDATANQWSFSLKDVPHEGFSSWGYELYTVKVDTSKDNSPIASFTLDSRLAKKEYHVGDALKIDDLIVEAVTEQGNNKIYQNWDLAKAAGFSISPENNTTLNTVGENTITVRYQKGGVDLSQTFSVNVKDLANQVPAKVEIRTKAGELVKRYSFTEAQWEEKQGMLSYVQVPVPKKFETAWNNKEFTAKAFNKDGDELKVEINRRGLLFRVQFPDYIHDTAYQNAMLSLSFKFEENAPEEKEETETPKPETPKTELPKEENKLADGIYYGSAKEGIHFQTKGPNIVKVEISKGKIVSAESISFKDDISPKFFAQYRDQLLERLKGLDSVEEVKNSINNKSGKYYDGLAGATRTLRAHTSAVENALDQAKKKKTGAEFPFSYMEFFMRPNAVQSGSTLDLSVTRLKLHFPNGEEKIVKPAEFAQYGITTTPEQGSPIQEGQKVLVHFLQKDLDIDMVYAVVPRNVIRKKYPTEIQVHYANGDSSTITLDKENFRYIIPAKGKIDHMHLMDGNKEVARSRYDAAANQWSFSLKDVPHEGFSSWGYELYTVKVDTSQDKSPIASFKLDTHLAKKEYHVGDALKIDDLIVEAVTEQGNNKLYQNWELAKAAGFTVSPENNTALNTVGENTITVRYQKDGVDLSQTFTVNVKDLANQVPAKVEIRTKAGELVKRYNFTEAQWEEKQGMLSYVQVPVPKKFETAWNNKEFTAKAFNKDGDELKVEINRKGLLFRVQFPDYTHDTAYQNAMLSLSFKFEENAPEEKEETETPKPETPKTDIPKPDTKPENPKEETPKKDDKTSSSTIEKPTPSGTEANDALLPAHVEVYWHGEKVVDDNYNLDEVKKHRGQLIFKGVKVPAKMKGQNKEEDFTVVIKNSKGENLPYTRLEPHGSNSHARIIINLEKRYSDWAPMRIHYVWNYIEDPVDNKPDSNEENASDYLLPSHVEVFWHDEKVVDKEISKEQVEAARGQVVYDDVPMSGKKRNYINDYTVIVRNKKGEELPQYHTPWNRGKKPSLLVNLKNAHPQWGKMRLSFIWKYEDKAEDTGSEDPKKKEENKPVENPKEETEPSYIKTFYGESEVVPYGYTVKVKVKWDSQKKAILKVEDNETFSGSNSAFWDNVRRRSMPALVGKNKENMDGIDAVANCTFSRDALLDAVRNAIPEE